MAAGSTPREGRRAARAWSRGREWWDATIAHPWIGAVAEASPEPDWGADPALFEMVKGEVRRNPVFQTLGREPEEERGGLRGAGGHLRGNRALPRHGHERPARACLMIALAWDYLRAHGTLTNRHLLDVLLVHRSSFVCGLIARLGRRTARGRGSHSSGGPRSRSLIPGRFLRWRVRQFAVGRRAGRSRRAGALKSAQGIVRGWLKVRPHFRPASGPTNTKREASGRMATGISGAPKRDGDAIGAGPVGPKRHPVLVRVPLTSPRTDALSPLT